MVTQYDSTKARDYRRVRPEVVLSVILLLIFAIILGYIYWDSRRIDQVVDNSENQAVLGVYENDDDPFKTVYESGFKVDVPADWTKINNPEIRVSGSRYYPIRYQGVSGYHVGRWLDVYVGSIPKNLPVNKILVVKVIDNIIVPQQLSPQCHTFTDFPAVQKGEAFNTVWEGHTFTCETSYQDNSIAIIVDNYNDFVSVDGPNGARSVMLVYTDHGGRPNNEIFNDIVTTFALR